MESIAHNGAVYACVPSWEVSGVYTGPFYTSTDLVTLTARQISYFSPRRVTALGSTLFVDGYTNSSGTIGYALYRSTDNGASWAASGGMHFSEKLTVAGGKLYAIGASSASFRMYEPGAGSRVSGSFPESAGSYIAWHSLAHNGKVWCAIASGSNQRTYRCAVSSDGVSFTSSPSFAAIADQLTDAPIRLYVLGSMFIALGWKGATLMTMTSDNGVNWQIATSGRRLALGARTLQNVAVKGLEHEGVLYLGMETAERNADTWRYFVTLLSTTNGRDWQVHMEEDDVNYLGAPSSPDAVRRAGANNGILVCRSTLEADETGVELFYEL
jgi:hypothetical protein